MTKMVICLKGEHRQRILTRIKGNELRNSRGFSLAELLITVFILVTVIVILLQLFIYNSVLAELSGNMGNAMSEAQTKMEEIRNHDFDKIVLDYTSTCACADTVDNDGDGQADYSNDAQCLSYFDNNESDAAENRAVCTGTFSLTQPSGTATINISMIYPSTCATQCKYDLIKVDITSSWQNKDGRTISKVLTSYIARR